MQASVAFQECVNRVFAAYKAHAGVALSFQRLTSVDVDGLSSTYSHSYTISLPQDLLPANATMDRIPFSPVFNPLQEIRISGYVFDSKLERLEIREGIPLVHKVPTPSDMGTDVVSYGLRQYKISDETNADGSVQFDLLPTRQYAERVGLWLTSATFSSDCTPRAFQLAGPYSRRMTLIYGETLEGMPVISSIRFEEILPLTRQHLILSSSFERVVDEQS